MFITIITDCFSENDKARQATRFAGLFGIIPTIVGVSAELEPTATLEASGNLVDTLDAADNNNGIVVVNVAPRGDKKEGANGTHFAYFKYKNVFVISTIKGHCLSLVKKLNLVKAVRILNTEEVLNFAEKERLIDSNLKRHIVNSQFRSFDFVPRVAKWLSDGVSIPHTHHLLSTLQARGSSDSEASPSCIWLIDSFGNCKTTFIEKDIKENDGKLKTNIGTFKFYNRLKDVPKGETAIYVGSSGLGEKRFLEFATQATSGSAAKTLNLRVGDTINLL
jgi:hypothetical protein